MGPHPLRKTGVPGSNLLEKAAIWDSYADSQPSSHRSRIQKGADLAPFHGFLAARRASPLELVCESMVNIGRQGLIS